MRKFDRTATPNSKQCPNRLVMRRRRRILIKLAQFKRTGKRASVASYACLICAVQRQRLEKLSGRHLPICGIWSNTSYQLVITCTNRVYLRGNHRTSHFTLLTLQGYISNLWTARKLMKTSERVKYSSGWQDNWTKNEFCSKKLEWLKMLGILLNVEQKWREGGTKQVFSN